MKTVSSVLAIVSIWQGRHCCTYGWIVAADRSGG
jgi:hypothetical protein